MEENLIALFECEMTEEGVRVSFEKHYRLVNPKNLTTEELESYRKRAID